MTWSSISIAILIFLSRKHNFLFLNYYFFKLKPNIEFIFGCAASCHPLKKIVNVLFLNFWDKKRSTRPNIITVTPCSYLKKKWPNYAFKAKSAPNSDSFWEHGFFKVCMQAFRFPNSEIFLAYMWSSLLPKSVRHIHIDSAILPLLWK